MPAKFFVFLGLTAFAIAYLVILGHDLARARPEGPAWPSVSHLATGFGTNFLDTLGIGSFATSTVIFKFFNMLPDELIPGTLNAGILCQSSCKPSFIFQSLRWTLLRWC